MEKLGMTRRGRPRLPFLLVPLLAGCLGGPNGTSPVPAPSLTDFESCEFQDPDGLAIPCENQARQLGTEASPPAGWACVRYEGQLSPDANAPRRWWFYRSKDPMTLGLTWGHEYGMRFQFPDLPEPFYGAMYIQVGERLLLYSWGPSDSEGFLRFPDDLGEQVSFNMHVHAVDFRTNTSALEGAQLSELWSLRENRATDNPYYYWVLHRLNNERGSFHFETMDVETINGQPLAVPTGGTIRGEDFEITFDYHFAFRGGSGAFRLDQEAQC